MEEKNITIKKYPNITLQKAIEIISEHKLSVIGKNIRAEYINRENGLVDLTEIYEPYTV